MFGLNSKMSFIKNTDGKQTKTAKGVSVAPEFKKSQKHFVQQKNNET